MKDDSIIIIGAGFAGLSAGIYAQLNGFRTQIFEMHDAPGGLCTAWKRQGYTIDGCIHWLVGSSPESGMFRYWEEVGVTQGREFIYMDEYMRFEGKDGRTLIFYTDVDRLERHLLEFSPQDAEPIKELTRGIRMCLGIDQPTEADPLLKRLQKGLRSGWLMLVRGKEIQKWMSISMGEYALRFKDPVLREAFHDLLGPEFSMFFLLMTFAFLHNRVAGYPIGGSLPMSYAMARRYTSLGGVLHYNQRVEEIIVEEENAVGVRTASGSEYRSGRVILAADGYTTIFKMLGGKYGDDKTREPYEKWPTFPSLLLVGVGVNQSFASEPKTISGISIPLRTQAGTGGTLYDRLIVRPLNQDPTLAPPGKTSLVVMMYSDYKYWIKLASDPEAYQAEKDRVAQMVVEVLCQRFPSITGKVEMVDVATPWTYERYTGNWKGSFEGWLLTPQNAQTVIHPMSQTLPGLGNFYMCGQWVEPGGGLPTSVMSGRRLVQALCKEEGKKFQADVLQDVVSVG